MRKAEDGKIRQRERQSVRDRMGREGGGKSDRGREGEREAVT